MRLLPHKIPSAYVRKAGSAPATSDVDTGGYDVLVGGLGFRLATDQNFPYLRSTEATTVRRFDTSAEVGEQTLSPLPWNKSQSSFHAGAGQQNLEAPFTAFQYQQEQIAHLRFDMSLGVDCWTPGQVKRLPDTTFTNYGFDVKCVATATIGGIDYAVVGGVGALVQIAWNSGPDSPATVTTVDLTSATFGGASNISVKSITTDGTNYYAVIQLTAVGSTAGILTYIITGQMNSSAAPVALYEVPNYQAQPPRTNLCTNPNFETDTTGWAAAGTPAPSIAQSAVVAHSGTKSLQVTSSGADSFFPAGVYAFPTTVGKVYTCSAWVYNPTTGGSGGQPTMYIAGGSFGSKCTTKNAWQRVNVTFTATATSHSVGVTLGATGTGQVIYLDDVLIEQTGTVGAYFDGSTAADSNYTYSWSGTTNESTSSAAPKQSASNALGVCAWVKERLIAAVSNSVYELPVNTAAHSALPNAKFTHPISTYQYMAVSESPDSILISGTSGLQSTVLAFKLDTSGNTPTLAGGATVATLPVGTQVLSMITYSGNYLVLGTNKGVQVGTFDTYNNALTVGPVSLTTTAPVYALCGRDRFAYAGYSNQQADGHTGLARLDLSLPIDAAGRLAWAPDLRPPTSAPTGMGTVWGAAILPVSGRLMFITSEGLHVEGNGPGSNGTAWLRTSRIRFDTTEPKLFKAGRISGTLDSSTITITGITPFGVSTPLGTFGFVSGATDPGQFGLPTGLNSWLQLQFQLNGSSCVLNSYIAKAYPAPARQRVITLTVNCFRQEVDRYGLEVTDPVLPRDRYNALKALESSGNEIRFVEFTNLGAVATLVVIDQIEYHSFSRPNIDDDFGGYLTLKLRETAGT